MFVGHALIAFALTALLARRFSVPRGRALHYGVLAGLFATLPDVDIVYAPVGLLLQSTETVGPDVFWETANVVHRGPTHSLVMAGLLAVAAYLWVLGTRTTRALSVALVAALVVVGALFSGPVGAAVVLVFALAGLGVAQIAATRGVAPQPLLVTALVGLLSHPFGDLFTGGPPPFLYPFDVTLVTERIALHPDPTGQLLAAFAVELGAIWLGVWTYARLKEFRLADLVTPRATLGVGYAGTALLLPAPTLEHASPFVFSVLAVGVVAVPVRRRAVNWPAMAVTGLSAVTVAAAAYAIAYGLL